MVQFKKIEISKSLFVYDSTINGKKYRILKNDNTNKWDLLQFDEKRFKFVPYYHYHGYDTKKEIITDIESSLNDSLSYAFR